MFVLSGYGGSTGSPMFAIWFPGDRSEDGAALYLQATSTNEIRVNCRDSLSHHVSEQGLPQKETSAKTRLSASMNGGGALHGYAVAPSRPPPRKPPQAACHAKGLHVFSGTPQIVIFFLVVPHEHKSGQTSKTSNHQLLFSALD